MSKLFNWAAARIVAAFALALPLAAMAVTTTGYEDFGDTAGVVLWRGTQNDFHASTVADVAADGTVGDEYTMNTSGHPWQVFARGQSAYTSPGKVLVYDTPGTGSGYKYNPDCSFTPISFGGMWVKTLAINGQPFSILGNNAGRRYTEFGASGASTLFKFDASFTINRTSATTFFGDATVEIANGATFTAQADSNYGVVVDSAATLKLKGAGTLAVTTMTVAGALDLSAETVPTIAGNVTLSNGSTLVVPENTTAIEVCSGTLTVGEIMVKIGDADPAVAEVTTSGGSITSISVVTDTVKTFTSDYPSEVPYGFTYTYEATEAVTIPAVTVNGTLKTSGPITITDLDIANGADFEVVAGNTTVGCSADCKLKGNITVDAGATLTNTRTDSLSYNHSMTVDIYGTLAMGGTRWSIPGGCTFKLRAGAQVTGTGDGWASLDFINGASRGLDVYGSATIEGKMRVRKDETRIWINEKSTLVLASGIADGGGHQAGFKQVGPGTLEIHANATGLSGNASIMTQGTLRLIDTTLVFPVSLQGSGSYLEVVATEAATTVPVNVTTANNNVTFSGAGKVNGSITKTSAPGGNLATALQSSAWTGTFVADWAGAHGTQFDANAYGNANSVVEVTKLVGGYVSAVNAHVTVVPTIKVSGFMNLENGYSGKVTTLTKLTGSGVFSNQTYSVNVTTLDNFTGTLVPLIDSQYVGMKIGTINLSSAPAFGDKIVNLGEGANIGQIANTKVSVNGVVDESFTGMLEVKSDGIYVKSLVTVTVPKVANTTVAVSVGGNPVSPATEGESANTYSVVVGSTVTVTYSSDDYEVTGGSFEFTASEDYTVDTTGVTTAQYVASITVGEATTKYTSLQAAVDAVAQNKDIVLLDNVVDGATVDRDVTFSVVPGEYTYGDIVADGDYILTTTALEGKTRYTFAQAVIAVTINEVRTLYTMMTANTGIEAANAGPIGTTIEILSGDPSTYVEYLPMFDLNTDTGIFTKVANPVAAVYDGVLQVQVYRSLAAAIEAATAGQTVKLLADDHVSFSAGNLEIAISKALTIDGAGYTVYGINDYAGGSGDHDIYISGSGDVTIKNVTLANFAGGVGNNMRTYPIWTGQAYAGTLTLDNVTVQNFNRTAFNLNGGTVVVTNCTITGDTTKEAYFQEGIGVYNANVTIVDTAISNVGSNLEKEDSQIAACIQLGNPNGPATGTGSITVVNGTYSGEYGIIVASNAQNTVSVQGGTFVGDLMVEEGEGGTIAVSGGTFDAAVPAEYCADGYEPKDNGDETYTVRVDLGWIYEAADHPEYTGSWSNDVVYSEGKVHIEDGNTYTANRPSDGQLVTVAMTLSFDDANDEDEDVGDAKAAVRLASGETSGTYQFQLYTSDGGNKVWSNATVDVAATKEQDYTFVFVLDLTNKTYTASIVDGVTTNAMTVGGATDILFAYQGDVSPVQKIEFIGSGSVTSIKGSYEDVSVPVEEFVDGEEIGSVTLDTAQAAWLNGQDNYAALAGKIATMSQDAFNKAYLLNLDILSEFTYEFTVSDITIDDANVFVTVLLTRNGEFDGPINGTLKLTGTDELGKAFEVKNSAIITDEHFSAGDGELMITFPKDADTKFFQPVIE